MVDRLLAAFTAAALAGVVVLSFSEAVCTFGVALVCEVADDPLRSLLRRSSSPLQLVPSPLNVAPERLFMPYPGNDRQIEEAVVREIYNTRPD